MLNRGVAGSNPALFFFGYFFMTVSEKTERDTQVWSRGHPLVVVCVGRLS